MDIYDFFLPKGEKLSIDYHFFCFAESLFARNFRWRDDQGCARLKPTAVCACERQVHVIFPPHMYVSWWRQEDVIWRSQFESVTALELGTGAALIAGWIGYFLMKGSKLKRFAIFRRNACVAKQLKESSVPVLRNRTAHHMHWTQHAAWKSLIFTSQNYLEWLQIAVFSIYLK